MHIRKDIFEPITTKRIEQNCAGLGGMLFVEVL